MPVENMPNDAKPMLIGLAGNPNVGKTSLFNRLTGMRQRVGNYPGVTVEKKTGTINLSANHSAELIDLPGIYSLGAGSPDERVAADILLGKIEGQKEVDLAVVVVDATNLQRTLFLAAQITDLGIPVIIALNLWDEATNKNLEIDYKTLSKRLGVPCIPTSAKNHFGIEDLQDAIKASLDKPSKMLIKGWPDAVEKGVKELRSATEKEADYSDAEFRRILFDAHSSTVEEFNWDPKQRKKNMDAARKHLFDDGMNPMAAEALIHYQHLSKQLKDIVKQKENSIPQNSKTESIDKLLLHRGWGVIIFVAAMYVVFQSVYTWAAPFMDLIGGLISYCQGISSGLLSNFPILNSLVSDGMIEGVGAFLVFLPQILILFLFIALLEDSGYMARAAFLMDKLFAWAGLNGKSFVPMLSSYACAVPGVMATRTIDDPKARLITILMAPFMSCSARLPVYILFIGTFIEPVYGEFWAGFALFSMHIIGHLVAIPTAFILTKFILKTKPQPFILELPPYRVPQLKDVLLRMYERGMEFVKTAGTIICCMTIIIWALLYFPRDEAIHNEVVKEYAQNYSMPVEEFELWLESESEETQELSEQIEHSANAAYMENSYLGRFGKFVQPVFAPAGFDWKITVGILSSFPAREVIISTFGIIYKLGDDTDEESHSLRETMVEETHQDGKTVYTLPVIIGLMLFFALCQQCGATVAIIVREAGTKWAIISFTYMTFVAWFSAVMVYQIFG